MNSRANTMKFYIKLLACFLSEKNIGKYCESLKEFLKKIKDKIDPSIFFQNI